MFSGAWNWVDVKNVVPSGISVRPRSAKPAEESVFTALLKRGRTAMRILYQGADHLLSGFEPWVGNRVTCREVVHDLSLHRA
jgi:glycine/serine hydroxymethyltransferase